MARVITAIAAMTRNRVIGRDGRMPWHLPEDLKHFKKITLGKPVIMGRKTFESIGRPLPGRPNLVISRSGFQAQGVTVCSSLDEALTATQRAEEIMIIGGGQIYKQALPLIDRLHLTLIDATLDGDAYFPEINSAEWLETFSEAHPGNPPFRFVTLERKK